MYIYIYNIYIYILTYIIIILYIYIYVHCDEVFSLGCFWGVLHPPIAQIYSPTSVSEAAAPPIRVMACKANLHSIIITKQLYTCKYTATDCAIVMFAENRDSNQE